jgi:hypothetical protein
VTTDLPYTDTDLRAEAASCLAALSIGPTAPDIRRSLPGTYVDSHRTEDGGATWDDLLGEEGLGAAAGKIHGLVDGAADVSEWAINLGADGLEPSSDHVTVTGDDRPIVRIHLAFDPGMPAAARAAVTAGLGQALADLL